MNPQEKFIVKFMIIEIAILVLFGIFLLTYSLVIRPLQGELMLNLFMIVLLGVVIIGLIGEYIHKRRFKLERVNIINLFKSSTIFVKFLVVFCFIGLAIVGISVFVNVFSSIFFKSESLSKNLDALSDFGIYLFAFTVIPFFFMKGKEKNNSK